MRFSLIVILASTYTQASLGGTLEIIDIDNQYAIWSYNNYSYIGSSAFFSQLDRDEYSTRRLAAQKTIRQLHRLRSKKPGLDNRLKHSSRCTASDLKSSTKSSSTKSSSTEPSSTKSSSTKSSSALITPNSSSSVSKSSSTTFQTASTSDCSAA
ncbi:hypothetical protein N7527_007324 [Penicillium freii]|nr:hypothetical protein N7527_007324 [Penicillium freii]